MSRLLYVTPPLQAPGYGGREMLANLHWQCLQRLFGDGAAMHVLVPARPTFFGAIRGEIDGATQSAGRILIERIVREGIDRIFLNGSNLGHLAMMVKRAHPDVEVLTFFHNVETRFFLGAFRQRSGLRPLAVLAATHAAERKSVRFSDRLIVLSRRDGAGLARLYGKGATDILPMALADQPRACGTASADGPLLFVGGSFYANRAGIRWFAREVAPQIHHFTQIVGRGLEDLRGELERQPNVRLIGEVDDLGPYYRDATAVIAPIFDGSGMKTKVAEALMHGKRVIGTSESFVGYEAISDVLDLPCNDANAFVARISALNREPATAFDPALRLLFDRHYSTEATRDRLAAILGRDLEGGGQR